ncbi:MAG TPA: LLM class flavin-dependent oxidoreductase [Stellaceae bacterium]|jgi:alkanesulfonate monooxygenase|nr:LLM class flavin-dependent oxidoreductase [Stellaceae bacterium]
MKEIRLNAFEMNCVGHQSPGLWAHPRDRSASYTDLDYWIGLAKTLERGRFDGIFLADVLGIYDVYGGSPDAALRHAVQVPVGDPLLLVPAMAAATEHLGFGVTCTLSYEPPYTLARRLSTLDHLTKGRAGWNIVTGYLDSAAAGMGLGVQARHDQRYEVADEYMEVVYKLWEGSWDEGAVLRDRQRRRFADPRKIHRIRHEGQFYRVDAIHLCEPSPQRTPVLYQAGASTRGRAFAAAHAECVFINGPSPQVVGALVADLRRRAAAQGRDPADLLIFTLATVITGKSEAEARAKHAEYRSYADVEASLALFSGWTGVDFSGYRPDDELRHIETEASRSSLRSFTTDDPDRVWTVRELAEHVAIGGRGPLFVGSPEQIADTLMAWVETTDIDGFNLAYAVTPESFEDFVELVVPELTRRGVYKRDYSPGTLREKLFGPGRAHLAPPHPATRHRSGA